MVFVVTDVLRVAVVVDRDNDDDAGDFGFRDAVLVNKFWRKSLVEPLRAWRDCWGG